MKANIFIGADHAGFELKNKIIEHLRQQGYNVNDCGTYSTASVDYPDFAINVAEKITTAKILAKGILVCGSGTGMAIAANKVTNARAANCYNTEIARLARLHNDANICCLGARFIETDLALRIVDEFLNTEFEGGRHLKRVRKIE